MLGSDPVSSFLRPGRSFGEPMMEVEDVTLINESGNTVVNHVSLHVRAGEIVGIYGLMGAGRTELFECLLGTQQNYLGTVRLNGTVMNAKTSTAERIRLGMSLVPEDRKKPGFSLLHRSPVI